MKAALHLLHEGSWSLHPDSDHFPEDQARLVLGFGTRHLLEDPALYHSLRGRFPAAYIALCSTAGEIFNTEVRENSVAVTSISFDHTEVKAHAIRLQEGESSYEAGRRLLEAFDQEGLGSLFVLSDGSKVNGSELVRAFNRDNGQLLVTGGLAGDGDRFESTLVGLDAVPEPGCIAGIGFYGDKLQVSHGFNGGWETFGLEKTVTRSRNNVLYEMDHNNALGLYKNYLGADADALPGSALLFPLTVTLPETGEQVVRTILSIDQDEGSMTFAGDIPEGAQVRFMKANFDKIISAASGAALETYTPGTPAPRLALLVSCVGRKLILQSRTDEELEAIDEVFGHQTLLTGFYSYGEISPLVPGGQCQLHNQTMTITTFYEAE